MAFSRVENVLFGASEFIPLARRKFVSKEENQRDSFSTSVELEGSNKKPIWFHSR